LEWITQRTDSATKDALKKLMEDYVGESPKFIDGTNTLVGLAILHWNEGIDFRKSLLEEIMDHASNPAKISFLPTMDSDLILKDEDIPSKSKNSQNVSTKDLTIPSQTEREEVSNAKKTKRIYKCKKCGQPKAGHTCSAKQ